jgi:hypothetical protein
LTLSQTVNENHFTSSTEATRQNPRNIGHETITVVWQAYLKRYFLRRATHLVMTGGLFRKNTNGKSKKWLEK